MGITVKASGTQTATLDSTHTLLSTTDPGVFVFSVDVSALAVNSGVGEYVELEILRKVLTGGTVRRVHFATYQAGLIDSPITQSIAVVAPFGADFKLKQPTTSGGSGRSFPWSVEQLDA